MELNADLIARGVLRMMAEIESLTIQRDAMAEEIQRLRKDLDVARTGAPGPRAVPASDERPA